MIKWLIFDILHDALTQSQSLKYIRDETKERRKDVVHQIFSLSSYQLYFGM